MRPHNQDFNNEVHMRNITEITSPSALPAGFPFPTNTGLHGDMLFVEMKSDLQFTISEPIFDENDAYSVAFRYQSYDSDEGSVTITYQALSDTAREQIESDNREDWDVEISAGSDVWGTMRTAQAISEAVALHYALGRNLNPQRD